MGSLTERVNVGVAAVVLDDEGQFLISQRLADKHGVNTWGFPGGKPDPGESPEEACLRELEEETGLKGAYAAPLGVWTYDRWDDYGVHYVTLYFMVDVGDQVPVNLEPEKHSDWEFRTADEILYALPAFSGVTRIVSLLA